MVTKVRNIEQYLDGQESHTVAKGKFVLIKTDSSDINARLCINKQRDFPNGLYLNDWQDPAIAMDYYKLIIISETEDTNLDVGTWVYHPAFKLLSKIKELIGGSSRDVVLEDMPHNGTFDRRELKKVLALPEQFSAKQLQAIVANIKDNDEVYLKCKHNKKLLYQGNNHFIHDSSHAEDYFHIELLNGNVTLFFISKKETWLDILRPILPTLTEDSPLIIKLEATYHPPIKKTINENT